MLKGYSRITSWDFFSKIIIISFLVLQIVRWIILPQFMDIYYHLLTAWGFLQAGGYSGWDFWQYAPVGRVHIYPPFFHLVLAMFMKLGVSQIILAKLCEAFIPWVLILVTWDFIRRNYTSRLGFFVVFAFLTSFSFYSSLLNHIPATIGFIFGVLSLGKLFRNKLTQAAVLLALSIYTHIGISVYMVAVFMIYGLTDYKKNRNIFKVVLFAIILAFPMILKEVTAIGSVSTFGFQLNEKYLIQIKVLESLLAGIGLALAFKFKDKYSLFLSLGLANLVFLPYPYRFFSAEGYFAVLLLSALTLDYLYQRLTFKYIIILCCVFIILVSPTLSLDKNILGDRRTPKITLFDSAFLGIIFAKGNTLWHPKEYISAAKIVRDNSEDTDIVFSTLNLTGLTIASLAGRASANALLPEVGAVGNFNPLVSSKIIVFTVLDDEQLINKIVAAVNLFKIGENKFFKIYKNPGCNIKARINKASLPFGLIMAILFLVIFIYKFIKIV